MWQTLNGLSLLRALRHRIFAFLLVGQTVSRVGDFLYEIALAWWVLQKTGSPVAMAGVLVFAFTPMLLFLLIGGVAGFEPANAVQGLRDRLAHLCHPAGRKQAADEDVAVVVHASPQRRSISDQRAGIRQFKHVCRPRVRCPASLGDL